MLTDMEVIGGRVKCSLLSYANSINHFVNERAVRMSFITTVVCFFIVHTSFFVHKYVNEDSIYKFKVYSSAAYEAGRWFYSFIVKFHSVYTIPFISGILCAFYMGLLSVYTVKTLNIQRQSSIIIVSFLLSTFPTLAYLFGYDYTSDSVIFGLLLSAITVFLTVTYKYGFVPGAVFLMLSLAIYQASLGYCMGLFVIASIQQIIGKDQSLKEALWKLLRYLICGILGIALYMISVKISLDIHGAVMHWYKGMDRMGQIPLKMLPSLIVKSVGRFIYFFVPQPIGSFFYVSDFLFILYIIFFALMLISLIILIKKSRLYIKAWKMILLIGLLAITPIALNIIDVVSPYASSSTLNVYSIVLFYVLLIVLCDNICQSSIKPLKLVTLLTLFLIGYNHLLLSGIYYMKISTYYERTYGLYNRVLARIEELDEFEYKKKNPIIVIGSLPSLNYGRDERYAFPEIINDQGLWGQFVGATRDTEAYKITAFISSFFGVDFEIASQEQKERIITTSDYKNMGVWPAKNSVRCIDGVVVLNLDYLYPAEAVRLSEKKCIISNVIPNVPDNYSFVWYIYRDGVVIDSIWSPSLPEFEYEFIEPGNYSFGMWIRNESHNNVYYGLSNVIEYSVKQS